MNSKKIILFIAINIVALLTFFTSCKKERILIINPVSQLIKKEAGSFAIAVTSNTDWKVKSNDEWCIIDKISGSGDGAVVVTYNANPNTSERKATIIFSSTNTDNIVMSITQEAGIEKFYLKKVSHYYNDILGESYNLIFNEKHLLIKVSSSEENEKYIYEYNSKNNVIKESGYSYSGEEFYGYVSYEYNPEEKIIKETYYNNSNKSKYLPFLKKISIKNNNTKEIESEGWSTFDYNENGQIIKRHNYTSEGINNSYSIYNYNVNGNVSNSTTFIIDGESEYKYSEYIFMYDDKNSATKNLSLPKTNLWIMSENNIINETDTFFDEDGNITNSGSYSSSFVYNDNNYPIKEIWSGGYSLFEYESFVCK